MPVQPPFRPPTGSTQNPNIPGMWTWNDPHSGSGNFFDPSTDAYKTWASQQPTPVSDPNARQNARILSGGGQSRQPPGYGVTWGPDAMTSRGSTWNNPVQPPTGRSMDAFQPPPGYEEALKPFMEARMQRLKAGGWDVHNNTFNPQGGYTQAFLDWDAADKAQHPFNFPGVSQVNNPLGPITTNPSNQTTQPPAINPTPGTVTNPVSTQPGSVPQSTPDTNWFQNYMNRINYGFNFNYPNFSNQSQDMGF